MQWQHALDLHIDLYDYISTTTVWRQMLLQFMDAYSHQSWGNQADKDQYADVLHGFIHDALNTGPTYFAAINVIDMVQEAADEMAAPGQVAQMMRPWDLPTRTGFVVFERPWVYQDFDVTQGELGPLRIRAVSWGPAVVGRSLNDGRKLVGYNSKDAAPFSEGSHAVIAAAPQEDTLKFPDSSETLTNPRLSELEPNGVMFHLWVDVEEWHRMRAGWGETEYRRSPGPMFMVDMLPWSHYCPWDEVAAGPILDRLYEEKLVEHAETGVTPVRHHVAEFRRFMLAFGRFMEQRILQPEELFPGRPGMKRWEHTFGKPIDGERAKVLVLRRIDYEAMRIRPGDVNTNSQGLRARHTVRGHWHRYYMRSRQLPVGHPDAYKWKYVEKHERGIGQLEHKHEVTAVIR